MCYCRASRDITAAIVVQINWRTIPIHRVLLKCTHPNTTMKCMRLVYLLCSGRNLPLESRNFTIFLLANDNWCNHQQRIHLFFFFSFFFGKWMPKLCTCEEEMCYCWYPLSARSGKISGLFLCRCCCCRSEVVLHKSFESALHTMHSVNPIHVSSSSPFFSAPWMCKM